MRPKGSIDVAENAERLPVLLGEVLGRLKGSAVADPPLRGESMHRLGAIALCGNQVSGFVRILGVDGRLEEGIRDGREELKSLLGKAAIANVRLAYQAFKSTFYNERFAALREKGCGGFFMGIFNLLIFEVL